MSLVDDALELVRQNPRHNHFVGPVDLAVVEAAERALGVVLPPDYHQFLLSLGCGAFGAVEVYGVRDLRFEPSVPDAVGLTLAARSKYELPPSLVIVHSRGDGIQHAIDCESGSIVEWVHKSQPIEWAFEDFGDFLVQAVERELELLAEDEAGEE